LIKPGANWFYTLFELYEDSYSVKLDYSNLEQVIDKALSNTTEMSLRQRRRYKAMESWMGYTKAVTHPAAQQEVSVAFKAAFERLYKNQRQPHREHDQKREQNKHQQKREQREQEFIDKKRNQRSYAHQNHRQQAEFLAFKKQADDRYNEVVMTGGRDQYSSLTEAHPKAVSHYRSPKSEMHPTGAVHEPVVDFERYGAFIGPYKRSASLKKGEPAKQVNFKNNQMSLKKRTTPDVSLKREAVKAVDLARTFFHLKIFFITIQANFANCSIDLCIYIHFFKK